MPFSHPSGASDSSLGKGWVKVAYAAAVGAFQNSHANGDDLRGAIQQQNFFLSGLGLGCRRAPCVSRGASNAAFTMLNSARLRAQTASTDYTTIGAARLSVASARIREYSCGGAA
jgi:hypothetical protein